MVIIPAVVGRVVRQSHNPIRAALAVVIAATAASWITSARLLYVRVRTKFRGLQRCLHRRRAGARALLAPTGRRWQHPGRWVGALAATQETVNCSEEHEAARGRFRRLRRRRDCRPLGRARRGGDPGIVRLSPHHVYRHTSSAPHLPRAALRRAHLRPKQGMAAQQQTHRSDNARRRLRPPAATAARKGASTSNHPTRGRKEEGRGPLAARCDAVWQHSEYERAVHQVIAGCCLRAGEKSVLAETNSNPRRCFECDLRITILQ